MVKTIISQALCPLHLLSSHIPVVTHLLQIEKLMLSDYMTHLSSNS